MAAEWHGFPFTLDAGKTFQFQLHADLAVPPGEVYMSAKPAAETWAKHVSPEEYADLPPEVPAYDQFMNKYMVPYEHQYNSIPDPPATVITLSEGSMFGGKLPAKLEIVATFQDGHQEKLTFPGGGAIEMQWSESLYTQECAVRIRGFGPPQYDADSGPEQCVLPTGCLMSCHVIKEDKEDGQ